VEIIHLLFVKLLQGEEEVVEHNLPILKAQMEVQVEEELVHLEDLNQEEQEILLQ
jgi:hypothetical protein